MKSTITLIIALLAIIAITRLEDCLSKTGADVLETGQKQVDSYLSDFDMMAVNSDGGVDYRMSGHHLSYSQGEQHSQVIDAVIETAEGYRIQTARLDFDQQSREVSTKSKVFITMPSGTMQSTGLTGKLDENLLKFDADVRSIYQVK